MLLCFLVEYKKHVKEFPLLAVHVNHGIRGCDADMDEIFSKNICSKLGVEFISRTIDVPTQAKNEKIGTEECARNMRYLEFSKIISYEIFDDYTIKKGAQVANSKSKKSAGGTVLLGTAGALIGGASGAIIGSSLASTKTSTTISGGEDNIHHNFILSINIRDINKPLIKLHIGNNIDISMEINAIMTYIMELNK